MILCLRVFPWSDSSGQIAQYIVGMISCRIFMGLESCIWVMSQCILVPWVVAEFSAGVKPSDAPILSAKMSAKLRIKRTELR